MNGGGPSSPPDLTQTGGSSSQSSSTQPSSFHLDDGGIVTDLHDFEEIGLSDDLDRHGPSSILRKNSSSLVAMRDLTHAQLKRPPYPSVQTNVPVHSQSMDYLGPSSAKSSRRLASQSTPAIHNRRSRSRSPGPMSVPPTSPHPNGIAPPPTNGPPRHISPSAPKRSSWQLNRKTSEQIEEDYDSDDDVPVDSILYNVPISPRSSRALSATPSPERSSPPDSDILPAAPIRPITRAESESAVQTNGNSVSQGIRGRPGYRPEYRSKSWSDAMLEMGEDAKELSEALEKHAEEMENGGARAQRMSDPTPKLATKTSIVELPPLQLNNGMIDPLPISKEKEAVLSRTRPSWLPPKPKDEERRHLKEYQKMMRRSQEAERKRVEKERQEQQQRDRVKLSIHHVWEERIIPNWNTAIRTAETRELWWKGIAPRCRGRVWQMCFGNHLAVGPDSFKKALKRAKTIEAGVKKNPSMYSPKERELFSAIKKDVAKTFPELKIFQENGPLHESFKDVLMAYSMYRSDVGYVYGTHAIAGMLLLNLSPEQSFITLANILNRPLPLAFFTQDEGAVSRGYKLFLKAFQYKLPQLHRHIHVNLDIHPSVYLEPMFLSLFSLNCSVDITSRIWDVYAFEGDSFLIRAAVAILTRLESRLYGNREEVLKVIGWNSKGWDLGNEDEFMLIVRAAGKEDTDKNGI